jgi:hypothetical protein
VCVVLTWGSRVAAGRLALAQAKERIATLEAEVELLRAEKEVRAAIRITQRKGALVVGSDALRFLPHAV